LGVEELLCGRRALHGAEPEVGNLELAIGIVNKEVLGLPDTTHKGAVEADGQITGRVAFASQYSKRGRRNSRRARQTEQTQESTTKSCEQNCDTYLKITMADTAAVAIVNAVDELLEEAARHVLWKLALVQNLGEQLPAGHQVHHDVQLGGRCEHVAQVDNVLVLQGLHNSNLPSHIHRHLLGLDVRLVHHLHGHLLSRIFMDA